MSQPVVRAASSVQPETARVDEGVLARAKGCEYRRDCPKPDMC